MSPVTLLKTVGYGFAAFGLLLALAAFTPLAPLVAVFLDVAHLPLDGLQPITTETEYLLLAIAGGLCCGLGMTIAALATCFGHSHPQAVGKILLTGALAWYIPDSLGSYLSGAWFNVGMNTGFLALLVWPLALMYRATRLRAAQNPLR
ncbi:hypothetical protein TRM7557_03553 [Tritonibacter multivorans]|uniref:DUF4345 domain-containing protein n=1 Tax=Tritonibacter multivorans TaxID=928856 RepID=A0A0P1GIX9_9RHOB|nr:hypothetical protein [Tritonibacter multivorans]MDA7420392.1 excinuclease ABC subunit A [Tritonibacter multivorans]CUH81684.1 hypothetical protein TRM7557_03553 [Tritonibacter multivorans]SFC41326.1 hypothetical protein SAMN04488049_102390 [Tritonibacter multivorans]